MGQEGQDVDEDDDRAGCRSEEDEGVLKTGQGVEDGREQDQDAGEDDGPGWHLAPAGDCVQAPHERRSASCRQLEQVTPGRIEQGIQGGAGCRDNHEEDQARRPVHARVSEDHDERRGEGPVGVGLEGAPGHDHHDGHQGADVEDENADDDLVDGLGKDLARVLGLGDRNPHELDHLVGEEDHLETHEEGQPPIWCQGEPVEYVIQTGMACGADLVQTGHLHGRVAESDDDHDHGGDNHGKNQGDLDH